MSITCAFCLMLANLPEHYGMEETTAATIEGGLRS